MLVLLAAAAITAAPPVAERTPNLYRVPPGCPDARQRVVDRFGNPLPLRLGDLPAAGPMLLVERRIDGCPVITMMNGAPRTVVIPAPDRPNPPASAYKLRPLDKAAPKD